MKRERPLSRGGRSFGARSDGRAVGGGVGGRVGVVIIGGRVLGQRLRFQRCGPRACSILGGLCRRRRRGRRMGRRMGRRTGRTGGGRAAPLDFGNSQVSTTVNHQSMSIETANPLWSCMRAVVGYELLMGDTNRQYRDVRGPPLQDGISGHGCHAGREAKGAK